MSDLNVLMMLMLNQIMNSTTVFLKFTQFVEIDVDMIHEHKYTKYI